MAGAMQRVLGKSLGEILVEGRIVSQEQLDEALAYGQQNGKRLGEALVDLGLITQDHVSWALGHQYGGQPVEILPDMVDPDVVRLFPKSILRDHGLLPLIKIDNEMVVLTSDPLATDGIDALQSLRPDLNFSTQLGHPEQIAAALEIVFPERREDEEESGVTRVGLETGDIEPERLTASPTTLRWLLGRAIEADADLLLIQRGDGRGAAIIDSDKGRTVIREFDATVFEGLRDLLLGTAIETTPSFPNTRIWPGVLDYHGRHYLAPVMVLQSVSANGVRLRPLRTTRSRSEIIEEYALKPAQIEQVIAAAKSSAGKLTLLVVEAPIVWNHVLYHYMRGLSDLGGILFISGAARFALPGVYQYCGENQFLSRYMGALAVTTGADQVVTDIPVDLIDYVNLRCMSARPLGVTTVTHAVTSLDGRPRLSETFWEFIESGHDMQILMARPSGFTCLTAEEAKTTLKEWR